MLTSDSPVYVLDNVDRGTHGVHHDNDAEADVERLDEKLGVDQLSPVDRPIDYEKMEHQQIGVTRIETLWRHFGTNRPILTSLGLTIFREY